ncbi:MAG: DUF4270 family protein [Sphingobacteriaceae bacterium]|nr:MAG: DUF4270 family protein [Sphingobacteriaceae bacterium]
MKFSKLDLLTLLISLFILNSCKNPDKIGLDVDQSNQLNGTLIADTVTLNTQLEDSVVTSGQARTPLAYFVDPEIGTTEANLITNINLPGQAAYTIPEGTITIDSAILGLRYATGGFYGDIAANNHKQITFKANVFQVSEKPLAGTAYYNTKQWSPAGSLLGTKTFYARPNDSVRVVEIRKAKQDTFTKVVPQLRIPIDAEFIRTRLFTAGEQIKSNLAFQNATKGLYVTLDQSVTTGTSGGVLSFTTPDTLSVYIHVTNGDKIDTSVVYLPITNHAAQIKHTYSTAVTTALSNAGPNSKGYVKGSGGLRIKVGFPGLKNLPKNIAINRAELVIVPATGTVDPFAPLPRLTMYKFDLAKQRTFIEDSVDPSTGYAGLFGGLYGVPITKEYRFLLTRYIQNLVSGKTEDYGTFIGAANESTPTAIDINATGYPVARTILNGHDAPRVMLNIIYTQTK